MAMTQQARTRDRRVHVVREIPRTYSDRNPHERTFPKRYRKKVSVARRFHGTGCLRSSVLAWLAYCRP